MPRLFSRSAALAFVLLASCAESEGAREDPPVPVIAERVTMLPEQLQVEAVGSARAATSAELYPESAGLVTRVRFSAGNYVRRGAPLLELDARRERLAVDLARVAVQEASQLLARYRRIEDTGALSASQIEAGETALAAARVELEQAEVALADRTVRAPFSGHIGITDVDQGDRISPTTLIAQIDDRSSLYVDFPAPETVFGRLSAGREITAEPFSEPGRQIAARVLSVDSTVSADQRTYIVRAVIDNEGDRLRPGMSFRVNFTGRGAAQPAVPEEAIVWGGDSAYLWVIRDGKAVRVPLTIVSRREGMVLIDAPLTARDTVVVEGVQKVRADQAVKIVRRFENAPQPAVLRERRVDDGQPRDRAGNVDGG